jgi:hypothetical protein
MGTFSRTRAQTGALTFTFRCGLVALEGYGISARTG